MGRPPIVRRTSRSLTAGPYHAPVNRSRLTLVTVALAGTAALSYAQLGGYSASDLGKTKSGQAFLSTLAALNQYYLFPVDQDKVMQGAIQGALGSLNDEFTYYSEPVSSAMDAQNLAGEFGGIGVTLTPANADGTGAKVDNVLKTGAAIDAGVQIGDIIVKIGDKDVLTAKLDEVVSQIRGKVGTPVTVTFARSGKPFTVKMDRRTVTLVPVETTVLPGNVGYISLNTFYNEKAADQFRAAIKSMKDKKVTKLIVDLRDNGGGLLDAGVDIADDFLKSGPIVSLRERNGQARVYGSARNETSDYTGELVLLVNKNSASASEIVAGALQDNSRAKIIGEQTFGKGVAQIPLSLPNGGKVAIVNSAWLTPKGREIHKKGVTPDVVVKDTRYPTPFNFLGGGAQPGQKITFKVDGKDVTVTADKDGKFTYTAEARKVPRSDVQGVAIVDLATDAILKKAHDLLK